MKPGLLVRARKGYTAPRGKASPPVSSGAREGTSPELREALNSPMPVAGLGLQLFAAPFKGTDKNASVLVGLQVAADDLSFNERDGLFHDTLEVSLVAIDHQGKIRGGDRQSVELKLKPETHAAVTRAGFRMLPRFEVPPGRYQLRAAARETGGGKVGSVHYDLEVPEFTKGPLTMSGLVLSAASGLRVPTAGQTSS